MRKILICSAKGGVSKTTSAINISSALNKLGRDVILVDCNLTTPNVGLYYGIAKVERTIHDVMNKKGDIRKAIYLHKSGLKIIPGSISINSLKKVRPEFLKQKLNSLNSEFLIMDSSAGLGRESLAALDACDEVLILVNPELPSVADGLKLIKIAEELKKEIIGVVVCRKRGKLEMKMDAIENLMDNRPIIGVIPEDEHVKKALVREESVFNLYPDSEAGRAYNRLAHYLTGEIYNNESKKGFFDNFLEVLGLK
ncbi:cell division ATPase MinD [Candidatus Woesearchaeota archaeon]|nr:cell division ATPase MinD [Candidatus Woesearchaeota archaeon]